MLLLAIILALLVVAGVVYLFVFGGLDAIRDFINPKKRELGDSVKLSLEIIRATPDSVPRQLPTDGSVVSLNTNGKVALGFDAAQRIVGLPLVAWREIDARKAPQHIAPISETESVYADVTWDTATFSNQLSLARMRFKSDGTVEWSEPQVVVSWSELSPTVDSYSIVALGTMLAFAWHRTSDNQTQVGGISLKLFASNETLNFTGPSLADLVQIDATHFVSGVTSGTQVSLLSFQLTDTAAGPTISLVTQLDLENSLVEPRAAYNRFLATLGIVHIPTTGDSISLISVASDGGLFFISTTPLPASYNLSTPFSFFYLSAVSPTQFILLGDTFINRFSAVITSSTTAVTFSDPQILLLTDVAAVTTLKAQNSSAQGPTRTSSNDSDLILVMGHNALDFVAFGISLGEPTNFVLSVTEPTILSIAVATTDEFYVGQATTQNNKYVIVNQTTQKVMHGHVRGGQSTWGTVRAAPEFVGTSPVGIVDTVFTEPVVATHSGIYDEKFHRANPGDDVFALKDGSIRTVSGDQRFGSALTDEKWHVQF